MLISTNTQETPPHCFWSTLPWTSCCTCSCHMTCSIRFLHSFCQHQPCCFPTGFGTCWARWAHRPGELCHQLWHQQGSCLSCSCLFQVLHGSTSVFNPNVIFNGVLSFRMRFWNYCLKQSLHLLFTNLLVPAFPFIAEGVGGEEAERAPSCSAWNFLFLFQVSLCIFISTSCLLLSRSLNS